MKREEEEVSGKEAYRTLESSNLIFRRKKSTEELELDWSNKSNHAGVKVRHIDFYQLLYMNIQSLVVKYTRQGMYQNLTRLYLSGCQLSKGI